MDRKLANETSATDVVWAAAERIGKTDNAQDINRICDYLINKHWFQTAGDLRVAKDNGPEWQALDVPGRLKIAIQDVLDASLDLAVTIPPHGRSVSPFNGVAIDMQSRAAEEEISNERGSSRGHASVDWNAEISPTPLGCDSESYVQENYDYYGSSDYNTGPYGEEGGSQDAAQLAAYAAAWDAYYAANGYDRPCETVISEDVDECYTTGLADISSGIVEAHEVVVEEAVAIDEELLLNPNSDAAIPEVGQPNVECGENSLSWSCGQCTFLNSFDVAFCEMCCGHISLSPDTQSTPDTQQSTAGGDAPNVKLSTHPIDVEEPKHNSSETSALNHINAGEYDSAPVLPLPRVLADFENLSTRPHVLEPPLFVSIPSPTKPLSPLYCPTAPDLDHDDDAAPLGCQSTSALGSTVVVNGLPQVEISPASIAEGSNPGEIDYRALAFKGVPSGPLVTAMESVVPDKSRVEFTF